MKWKVSDNPGGYGVVGLLLAELKAALQLLDDQVVEEDPDFVISPLTLPKRIEAPTLLLLLDHPLSSRGHSIESLKRLTPECVVSCIDPNHLDHITAEKKFFLPHGGFLAAGVGDVAGERPIDLLFSGSDWSGVAQNAYEVKESRSRQIQRTRLLSFLEEAGLRVDIYGRGWDIFPGHNVHGEAPFLSILQRYRQAKIVLNSGPGFSHGGHERVFSAMIGGALAITDRNSFWEEHFVDGEDCLFYDCDHLDVAIERIREVLGDDNKRREIALNGQKKALAHHTWFERAKKIRTISLEMVRKECQSRG